MTYAAPLCPSTAASKRSQAERASVRNFPFSSGMQSVGRIHAAWHLTTPALVIRIAPILQAFDATLPVDASRSAAPICATGGDSMRTFIHSSARQTNKKTWLV